MLKCQLSEHNGHFQCLISWSHDFIDKSSQVGNTKDIWFSLSQSFALVYSTGLERLACKLSQCSINICYTAEGITCQL